MGAQGVEAIAALAAGQQDVLAAIAREKAELKPYLDAWERLEPGERESLRRGRAGEILEALEAVAKGIQARHQDMFGEDTGAAQPRPPAEAGTRPASDAPPAAGQDIAQKINMYRGLA